MKIILAAALAAISTGTLAQSHYVPGYIRSDGTLVQGHYQTNPDASRLNNWSTQGNLNPYTGQVGTRDPYQSLNTLPQSSQLWRQQQQLNYPGMPKQQRW